MFSCEMVEQLPVINVPIPSIGLWLTVAHIVIPMFKETTVYARICWTSSIVDRFAILTRNVWARLCFGSASGMYLERNFVRAY